MNRPQAWTRGADQFDLALSGGPATSEHEELLSVVADLRAVPDVVAREDFVTGLRSQLIAAAQREPARVEEELALKLTPRQRKGSRDRRLAAVVGGFAIVSATGSMAMASQSALPGDALYPVKRAIENAETNLQGDTSSRADAVLSHAEARLHEAEKLTARGASAEALSSTLQDFVDQTKQASKLALDSYAARGKRADITDLRAFAASSMDSLAALGPLVPQGARAMLITASQTVRQIDTSAWEACPDCTDGAITEIPEFASMPLADMLRGNVPNTASVSSPRADAKTPVKKTDQQNEKSTQPPESESTPTPPSSQAPDAGQPRQENGSKPGDEGSKAKKGPVSKTVDEVAKRVDKSVKNAQRAAESEKGLVGKLVDGVGGILSGLLG
ncbi:MAG: DUF5667 domain-containing protein [Nocardioidaceae bacterium]|nr:DUF5667 domain-containing protein [Nocardioidaceae bacterium]